MRADIVVKFVLALLILVSFWSWVLIIDKWIAFPHAQTQSRRFEKSFWSGRSLDELYAQHSQRVDQPFTAVFVAALREWKRSFEAERPRIRNCRPERTRREGMNVSIQREVEKIERGLGYLATVGSTAPFVGLFGTVWGIMNSFQAIAARQGHDTCSGCARHRGGLVRDGARLLAAIPAVVAYNRFVNEVGRYTVRLEALPTNSRRSSRASSMRGR